MGVFDRNRRVTQCHQQLHGCLPQNVDRIHLEIAENGGPAVGTSSPTGDLCLSRTVPYITEVVVWLMATLIHL